jgi:hypothetical protein
VRVPRDSPAQRPPAAILMELRARAPPPHAAAKSTRRAQPKSSSATFRLPEHLESVLGQLVKAGYVTVFYAGAACEAAMAGWSPQSPDERYHRRPPLLSR